MKKLETFAALIVAIIFIQTLFFKFTGASESIWIFSKLGIEPWGRFLSGIAELIASILILVPRTRKFGGLMSAGILGGAVMSHVFILGIVIQNDGGLLFGLAVVGLTLSLFITYNKIRIPIAPVVFTSILLFSQVSEGKVSYNDESDFGIHGYDPVSYLVENKAKEGKKEISYKFDGITYRFSDAKNLELFKATPEKYIPAYGGWCAYAMADQNKVDIDPKTFKIINGKTYLFYNGIWGNTLEKWNKDEQKLKSKADFSWDKLIK